jgi:DNA polymerase-3 subunit delta
MSPVSPALKNLNKAISGGKLERVYLLHGEEEFSRDQKVEEIISAALPDPSERDFNLDVRHGGDITAETLDSLLNTPPLLASRRVVVIRDVGALKKGARQILDQYLASPAEDVQLILVENGVLSKTEKTLPSKCEVVEFRKLEGAELEEWVEQYAQRNLGARITRDAARHLVDSVAGGSLGELASELEKLASYSSNDETIDKSAVEDLVGVRHGETLGDLLDAIAMRDPHRSLELLEPVLSQPRMSAYSMLLPLTVQMLGLAYAKALRDEGEPASRLFGLLMDFLKTGKPFVGRPWGEAVGSWTRAVDLWTAAELSAALEALLRVDISLKETRSSSDEQVLSSLILELCMRRTPAPRNR